MLYACGDTRYGKLCINDAIVENSVTKPVQVHFPVPSLKLNTVKYNFISKKFQEIDYFFNHL